MQIDFGKTAGDYAAHRAGFPRSFFDRLSTLGLARGGLTALDLGTGTGTVARGLAQLGLAVTGLDPSADLLQQARQLDRQASVDVTYMEGKAEATGLPPESFDLVTAGQCWHWFDRPAALSEVWRLLRPGGHLVIGHFDWLPLPGNLVEATEALILKHNPAWHMGGGNGIYAPWVSDLRQGGFADVQSLSYDEPALYSHEAWRGRIRASAGVAASLSPDQVAVFDRELAGILQARFPGDPQSVDHGVFIAWGGKV